MNEKFFDLKKEKQDRMINAALKVFALHGYRHACTDDIVKEAAISKGLLFHYFGSKLLYLYDDVKNEFFIHATEGCYAVFFPNDAHRPGVCVDGKPLDYRKVVVKVSVDLL